LRVVEIEIEIEEKILYIRSKKQMEPNPEHRVVASKLIVDVMLLYLLYIMHNCPCRPEVWKCHLTNIYGALAVIVLVIISYNGTHILSY
jgi:hypothetical protein